MKKESDSLNIPDKKYFRIGEVSDLIGVDPHVLRYWESEFSTIKPYRGKSKQRLYRHKDVRNLHQIKQLLHVQGYTIFGARELLTKSKTCVNIDEGKKMNQNEYERLTFIKNELYSLQQTLNNSDK
ncbi:MAG: MerR family transcriptional regulator [Desulfobulbaceae bacterium]|nr:MerR family transcriptional regulator [Desulfobulbaceae bacterium]